MKKSKEYKISIVLFIIALVLFGISMVTGLIHGFIYSTDKICMFLGIAFMGFGVYFLNKAKNSNDKYE